MSSFAVAEKAMQTRRRSIAPDVQRALRKEAEMKSPVALATALLVTATTAVVAQSQSPTPAAASSAAAPVRPGAATASAAAASGAAGYRSAFDGYRRYDDQPVGSWREANDLVGQIGGWQAYAREGQGEGHDMGAMKNMPGMSMPGMESKSTDAPAAKGGAGHDMGSMKTMPGMSMPGMESKPNGTSACVFQAIADGVSG